MVAQPDIRLKSKKLKMKKRTYIVSTYTNYEWITTEDAYCKLELMIKYHLKGYKVWDYPIWFVLFMKKRFNISLNWGNRNATFELYVKGSDQVTYHTPYSNF
jgi:hypothetical protein